MKHKISIYINKPAKDVFTLLSALDHFNNWLPPSPGYNGTELTSELPIGKGSTYKVITPNGFRDGFIDTFDPPKHLVYKETLKLPVGGTISISIEYTLSKEGDGTNLERNLVVDAPLLLTPILKAQESTVIAGIEMFMKAFKEEAEKS